MIGGISSADLDVPKSRDDGSKLSIILRVFL